MSKNCDNEMFSLNIFERAVQDPCCDGCDHEDDRCYDRSELGDSADDNDEDNEDNDEHDPLEDDDARLNSRGNSRGYAVNPLVRHQSSPTMPVPRPTRKRANSATLIRQISRQSALDAVTPATMSIEEGQQTDFAAQSPQHSPQHVALQSPQHPSGQRTRSSCACIPTHLYGLEKYVSSALDALSTVDFKCKGKGKNQDTDADADADTDTDKGKNRICSITSTAPSSIVSSPFSSQSSSFSNAHSDCRKKSFIEMSLAKSFSQ